MIFEFILPDIGEGISEALLVEWLVAPGDKVTEADDLATVSTDKVDVELPAPRAGVVTELCWQPGDTVPVGKVLLRIETEGGVPAVAKEPEPKAEPPAAPVPAASTSENVVAAPATRKRAAELGVDLAGLSGSGQGGRILMRDVEAAARPAAVPQPQPAPTPPTGDDVTREPLNSVRAVAFERLGQSVQTLAHSTMNFEARADAFLAMLAKLKPRAEKAGIALTPAALFAKCVATALAEHPRFNATIDEDKRELLLHRAVNLNIAVASDAGLLVPVIRNIAAKTLFETAAAITDVAVRAREGRLQVTDTRGGTFTLSNTGNLERARIISTRPVINAPQTAILWVSRISERPRVVDGRLEAGPMVSCSLSFDHRFIDGADATRFINDIADYLECPGAAFAGS